MKTMRVGVAAGCLWLGAAVACAAEMSPPVEKVYLLPMVSGFEQFLAQELVAQEVLQVVVDPQKADAFLTDHIGRRLEEELRLLLGGAEPEASTGAAEESASSTNADEAARRRALLGSFGRGRGTIFLIRREDGRVLWSTYQPLKRTTSEALHQAARQVASRLKKTVQAARD